MSPKATVRWEVIILLVVLITIVLSLLPAIHHARRERRDGIRRNELITFKRMLEEQNNELGYYPLHFNATPHQYTVITSTGAGAVAWYLRARLENQAQPTAAFDYEHNVFYQVVQEGEATYFDICGGEYTCGVMRDDE